MTAIAAAVVIIVVTILTAGAAAAAAQGATAAATGSTVITGTAAATTTTAAVVPTATAFGLGSMAGAAVSATATTTALSLVNNKGNLGDIFSDLTSAETLKGIATNTLTAGVLGGLSVSTDLSNTPSLTNPFPEIERLDQVIAHSVVSSGIDTAINGGSFGDKLTDRLKYAAVDAMADNLAGDIGDNYHNSDKTLLDEIIHKGSHAALGCAMAEANEMDCGSGATGGVIGEVAAQWYTSANAFEGETDLEWEAYQERGIQVANMASTIGAGLLGKDIDAAQMAGVNAAENNWLSIPLIVLGFGLLTASEQANAPTDENDVESGAALEWASGFVPVSAGASVVAKANPSWWQKVTSKLGLGGVGKGVLGKGDRIKMIVNDIGKIKAKNADDALKQVNQIVDRVEDAHSGVKKVANPGKAFDGRMYGPRSDSVTRHSDGSITAKINKGNLQISADGKVTLSR